MKRGKKYQAALALIEAKKVYALEEACELVKKTTTVKFDSTIDVSFRLNVDPRQADQQIRGTLVLPHGNGKTKRVLAITNKVDEAKNAGADFVGGKEMLDKIKNENWFDYDIIVATPDMMGELGKMGRVLGPKGLMPNPKLGTVTTNVKEAIANIQKGMVEYKNDSYGNLHLSVGKLSFSEDKLEENIRAIVAEIVKNKPTGVKGTFIKNVSLSSTMSPGIKIDINSFDK